MAPIRPADLEEARRACRAGAMAAGFVAIVTVIMVLASLRGIQAVPGATINVLALVDAVLFGAVAWGLLRCSRIAAVAGLGLFVIEKLSMPPPPNAIAWIVMLAIGSCLAYSILGAFAHARLSAASSATPSGELAA